MQVIERGRGAPIVFIQGLHGRWEYARLTVDALAKHFRVITFSLNDEPSADYAFDPSRPFDSHAAQVGAAMDAAGCDRAVVCGQSFGGLVALRFAALHPSRTEAMIRATLRGPLSPSRMAARARRIAMYDVLADCARVTVPTLVMTGEAALDYVVPVEGTSRYATAIRGARRVVLERTGHLGSLTRPDEFAGRIRAFTEGLRHAA